MLILVLQVYLLILVYLVLTPYWLKLAFHDADTDTDTDFLAMILARISHVSDVTMYRRVERVSVRVGVVECQLNATASFMRLWTSCSSHMVSYLQQLNF